MKLDPKQCQKIIFTGNFLQTERQCSRKKGHGPKGNFCKQHNPASYKKRSDKEFAKISEQGNKRRAQFKRTQELEKLAKDIPTEQLKHYFLVKYQ